MSIGCVWFLNKPSDEALTFFPFGLYVTRKDGSDEIKSKFFLPTSSAKQVVFFLFFGMDCISVNWSSLKKVILPLERMRLNGLARTYINYEKSFFQLFAKMRLLIILVFSLFRLLLNLITFSLRIPRPDVPLQMTAMHFFFLHTCT